MFTFADSIFSFLMQREVKVTKVQVREFLCSHAEYPSLLSVFDFFSYLKLDPVLLQVPFADLSEIPYPYIVQSANKQQGGIMVISSAKKLNVIKAAVVSNFEFYVLYVERNTKLKRATGKILSGHLSISRLITVTAISCILYIIAAYLKHVNVRSIAFSLLAVFGLFVSISYFLKQIGTHNVLASIICGGNEKRKCVDYSAKQLKVFTYSISELAIIYFASLFILSLCMQLPFEQKAFESSLHVLVRISIVCSCASIIYQTLVAKRFCAICAVINAVIWAQFLIELSLTTTNPTMQVAEFPFSLLVISIVTLSWNGLKKLLNAFYEHTSLRVRLLKFIRACQLYDTLFESPKTINYCENTSALRIGNDKSQVEIVANLEIFCSSCKKVVDRLSEVGIKHKDDVSIVINFTVLSGHLYSQATKVKQMFDGVHALHSKNRNLQVQDTLEIISLWYDTMDLKKFERICHNRFPYIQTETKSNINFPRADELQSSPDKILINGMSPFGDFYDINDLPWIILSHIEARLKYQSVEQDMAE